MREVTMYQCEICGNLYDTPEEAQRCESGGQPLVLSVGQRVIVQIAGHGEEKGTISASRIGKGALGFIPPYHPVYYRINPDSCKLGFVCVQQEFPDSDVRPLTCVECGIHPQLPHSVLCAQCEQNRNREKESETLSVP